MNTSAKLSLLALLVLSANASALERYVMPPAPQVYVGRTVQIEREISGNFSLIHIKRAEPAPFSQYAGDYLVNVDCKGDFTFNADLATQMLRSAEPIEELVFLTLPQGMADKCTLTVISRAKYPWTQVFQGTVASIPELTEG